MYPLGSEFWIDIHQTSHFPLLLDDYQDLFSGTHMWRILYTIQLS